MYNALVLLISFTIVFGIGACSKEGGGPNGKPAEAKHSPHNSGGNESADFNLIEIVKGKSFDQNKSITIGNAFDGYKYFSRKEWKQSPASNGKIFIDFVGWYKAGILDAVVSNNRNAVKGVEVKFVITPNGEFYVAMVSKLETGADGKLVAHPMEDPKSFMDTIYTNKEMKF